MRAGAQEAGDLRLAAVAAELESASKRLAPEAAAQEALLRALDDSFDFTDKSREFFFARYGTTRTANFIRAKLTK